MAAFKTFEEINAWQNARVLVKDIYEVTRSGSFCQDYGLKDQIQRAAVSICSNIAEGFERRGNKEFVNFLASSQIGGMLFNLITILSSADTRTKR